jgi:predicted nucleotidyltransferase
MADLYETLKRLLEAAPPAGVFAAYLFGSHAEGRAHRESDVDVAVLLDRRHYPTAALRFEARLYLISDLVARLRTDAVDVVVLNDAPPIFARRIATTGRPIFCADPEATHAFVRDVQLRAADVEPFLRRTQRVKLAALRR